MVGLGIFGLILGGIASLFCLCLAGFVALVEYDGWKNDRATSNDVAAVDIAALDDELERLFLLPSAPSSLPFRPARHGSHNRLHRGF
jgi:hypothetical protein